MKTLAIRTSSVIDQSLVCELTAGATLTIQFLDESLARVTLKPVAGFKEPRTWAIAPLPGPDVAWEGRPRESAVGFTAPKVIFNVDPQGGMTLQTSRLKILLDPAVLALTWTDPQSNLCIAADRKTGAYMNDKRTGAVRHFLARELSEKYYGLGDKTGPLNLAGRRLRTVAMDALGYDPEHGDPLYKHWPFVLSRTANGQWLGIYYDTLANCTFDFGCEHDNYHGFYRYVDIDDGDLDYYLMVGENPAQVIAQWMKLIGGTHLPPQWSVGYAQTAMGLADAPDAQKQLEQFIDLIKQHKVPISAFHYGSGYSSRGKRRYVFTWNEQKFPDPKALNAKFNDNGIRLVANIKPCLLIDHPLYQTVNQAGGFIKSSATQQPILEPFWDGQGAHLDFTQASTIEWWQTMLKQQVLDFGIDAGWNDNNEYAVVDEDAQCEGFGATIPLHRARALQAMLMTRATFEAQQAHQSTLTTTNKAEPAFTVSRAGSPGIQRYAQTWSGDNTTSWRTLKWNIRTGLQMSLSGLFNVGHDVGGFYGPVPDPELFVRWVQACCLNPRMVMNSWKHGGVSNLPWMHPQVTETVIAAIKLRYRLMPYLWSLFERANQFHEPIIRPTFYNFPDDERCYVDCDDFMLGDRYLVAPVVAPGTTHRTVYLPRRNNERTAWIDFETGEQLAGGQTYNIEVTLQKLPLFMLRGR
jgi:alpha-glucosidase